MAQRQETLEEGTGVGIPVGLRTISPETVVEDLIQFPARSSVTAAEPATSDPRRRQRALHRRGRARHRRRAIHRSRQVRHRRRDAQATRAQTFVYVERMPLWKSTIIAAVSLVFVLGIAVAVMIGMGQLLHILHPAKHFDIFYALHKEIVVASLAAVCLLWLIPPHPWAKRLVEASSTQALAGPASEERGGQTAGVTVLSLYEGRDADPWPYESQGVGG